MYKACVECHKLACYVSPSSSSENDSVYCNDHKPENFINFIYTKYDTFTEQIERFVDDSNSVNRDAYILHTKYTSLLRIFARNVFCLAVRVNDLKHLNGTLYPIESLTEQNHKLLRAYMKLADLHLVLCKSLIYLDISPPPLPHLELEILDEIKIFIETIIVSPPPPTRQRRVTLGSNRMIPMV